MKLRHPKAEFAAEFIDIEKASRIAGAQWEPFQLEMLNLGNLRFGSWLKGRQVAFSFTAALDAVVDGRIFDDTPHIFISLNLSEAQEKIRYAKAIWEAMDKSVRPTIKHESSTKIEFANGSRLISHPCTEPRGKPRARIYLDEAAHYKRGLDRLIYAAALPATSKGDGYIRMGSSPLGASGQFWEIHTQSMQKYPSYFRRSIPWWSVNALCNDIRTAVSIAPTLPTAERVARFGKKSIQEIFANMIIDDFMQEFECHWVDERTAWLTWEMIQDIQDEKLEFWHFTNVDDAIAGIADIKEAINNGRIEPVLYGGVDVGRHKHLTEFIATGRTTTDHQPLRVMISLKQCEYEAQEKVISMYLEHLPFAGCLIDQNGLGSQIAENMEKGGIAEGVKFTNATKELWAVRARVVAEAKRCPIPLHQDFAYQLHSIKKRVTLAGNNIFDAEAAAQHHADKFWAWALSLYAGKADDRPKSEQVEPYDPLADMEEVF